MFEWHNCNATVVIAGHSIELMPIFHHHFFLVCVSKYNENLFKQLKRSIHEQMHINHSENTNTLLHTYT